MASTIKAKESNDVNEKLQTVSALLAKYSDRIFMASIGVSQTQYIVLSTIASFGSPVTHHRVAGKIGRNLNTLSMMVDRLTKSGLVIRKRSETDRRDIYLELTEEGKKKVTKGKQANDSLNKRLADILGDKDVRELQSILKKLEDRITDEFE